MEVLIEAARDRGHAITHEWARTLLARFGSAGALSKILATAGLVDVAGTVLCEHLPFDAAWTLMEESDFDLDVAHGRLEAELDARRRLASQLDAPAVEELFGDHGMQISRSTAKRYARAGMSATNRLRALVRIRDAGTRQGLQIDATSAACRLASARGDCDLAVARVERFGRNKRLMQSRLCRVLHRNGTREQRIDGAAACRCTGCYYRLWDELAAYGVGILRKHARRAGARWAEKSDAELRQETRVALWEALLDWSGGRGFRSYYAAVVANMSNAEARRDLAEKRGHGERARSLESIWEMSGGYAREAVPNTVWYLLPDRGVDPALVLIRKEELLERRRSRREDIEETLLLFETLAACQ